MQSAPAAGVLMLAWPPPAPSKLTLGMAPWYTSRGPARTPPARDVHARACAAEEELERLARRGGSGGKEQQQVGTATLPA